MKILIRLLFLKTGVDRILFGLFKKIFGHIRTLLLTKQFRLAYLYMPTYRPFL